MGRMVGGLTVFGLLLASAIAQPNQNDWDIYSFHINSTVSNRYATTVITSRVANRMQESKEIEFHVEIPKDAFISKFRMYIDGQPYDGVVKTKEKAQQQYTQAVSQGQSAGIVSSVGRTLEEFRTSVNVAANKKVTFELTYEELMRRKHGKYELKIHARPMQPVRDFKIDVYMHEKAGITFVDIKGGLSTKELANAITKTQEDKEAWVHFYPTVNQQTNCDGCGEQGLDGELIISYDVQRDNGFGDIQKADGYFVHHFAPSSLPRIPKNVVFVIDRSGSMSGRKMRQTRIAMVKILSDLDEEDFFGLITFDSEILYWKEELVQATSANVETAQGFARSIQDRGATDINAALLEGARMLTRYTREGSASILILLTDGDPTTGVTNRGTIQENVRRVIAGQFPLYCLGFGFDVSFEFLQKLSLMNGGVARRIYEDSDADLQLKGFYEEVANPLLTDVTMIYEGGTNLTQTNFSQYYNGSEIVVAGQILDNNVENFIPQVVAISVRRKVTFTEADTGPDPIENTTDSVLQRVWAYLTVKQLLEKELLLSGNEKEKVKNEALELSLKYSFVTPLTSMVVTKPQEGDTEVLHKPEEGKPHRNRHRGVGSTARKQGTLMVGSSPISRTGIAQMAPRSFHPELSQLNPLEDSSAHHQSQVLPGPPAHPGVAGLPGVPSSSGSWFVPISLDDFQEEIDPTLQPPPVLDEMDYEEFLEASSDSSPPVTVKHRFWIKSDGPSRPLCFDIPGTVVLKLFHHPSRELYINGELDSVMYGGFKKIVIRVGSDQRIEVDTEWITVQKGQTVSYYRGLDPIRSGSATIIRTDKEIDIEVEDIRLVIYIHQKDREVLLWPVFRQIPSESNTDGLLVLKAAVYQISQRVPLTKVKINKSEVEVTDAHAIDYSLGSHRSMPCFHGSADQILPRPLSHFLVNQL
ncbi:inter-alpha-trypsin inhibitor heavy chain H3 isoform X3 [Oryzias melastigma]|uniref:inter-alpha-trypsin inhibitor heavy chain H3 isoform X3 n=1 Tax=Oryzias melastigma TaxID=30732 RepID=UPI00168CAE22|nr:inter-alpha-trypsin inhibitor heavy chain H3 isoform X3 [Oryzias melastigma]